MHLHWFMFFFLVVCNFSQKYFALLLSKQIYFCIKKYALQKMIQGGWMHSIRMELSMCKHLKFCLSRPMERMEIAICKFKWNNSVIEDEYLCNTAKRLWEPSWSWSYGGWIYNYMYLCNQCLSPLMLWVWIALRRGVLDTTLCENVCQWLRTGRWFSQDTLVSSTN